MTKDMTQNRSVWHMMTQAGPLQHGGGLYKIRWEKSLHSLCCKEDTIYASSSFPHLFPVLCGVDVSYDTPPFIPVLRVHPGQYSLSDKSFLMLSNHPALVFLYFYSQAPPPPSLSCLRIRLLFSIRAHTTSTYFPALSWIFLPPSLPLILSFLILPSLLTPLIHLNILISATSNFFSCDFLTAQVSAQYIIAGLTTVLYTFPLTLKLIRRSHRIPDTLFQCFHPTQYTLISVIFC